MHDFTADLPPVEVLLLEDRAQVIRRGALSLPEGTSVVRVADVTPLLVDKTLAGSIVAGEGVTVAEVRLERKRVVSEGDRPEALADIDARLRHTDASVSALEREIEAVKSWVGQLQRATALALEELAEDASWGRVDPGGWEARLLSLREAQAGRRERLAELALDKRRTLRERQDLRDRREAALDPRSEHRAELMIRLVADAATDATVQVEYLVPGACWRPWHRATLKAGALQLRSDGCVWQATGEDWTDVELRFSTERASLGVEPPELHEDELDTRPIGKAVAVSAREQTIESAGVDAIGGGGGAPEVGGIDDGGEARELRALAAATVPSDGRPHRFPIFSFETPARAERLLTAELAEAVILRTEHEAGRDLPLLPGPVDLLRHSGLVGRTWLDFAAPGERFELGWGPDLALRVHREERTEELESGLLSSWRGQRHKVTVRVSNLGPEGRALRVAERIPVSEIDKVKIELKTTDPAGAPDEDGFLRWTLKLPGYGRDEVLLEYDVKHHPDVVGL